MGYLGSADIGHTKRNHALLGGYDLCRRTRRERPDHGCVKIMALLILHIWVLETRQIAFESSERYFSPPSYSHLSISSFKQEYICRVFSILRAFQLSPPPPLERYRPSPDVHDLANACRSFLQTCQCAKLPRGHVRVGVYAREQTLPALLGAI